MFQVFQDGKPADTYHYPEIKKGLGWDNSIFETFEEAEIYLNKWAYPVRDNMPIRPIILGIPTDCSMSNHPVMMEIKEI